MKSYEAQAGWILPNGRFVSCCQLEHRDAAAEILKPGVFDDAEKMAERANWLKVSSRYFIDGELLIENQFRHIKPSGKQRKTLTDYCNFHKVRYPSGIAN